MPSSGGSSHLAIASMDEPSACALGECIEVTEPGRCGGRVLRRLYDRLGTPFESRNLLLRSIRVVKLGIGQKSNCWVNQCRVE
ncbi:hypothetical protein MRX96_023333 [Rhipicephalus microplus]